MSDLHASDLWPLLQVASRKGAMMLCVELVGEWFRIVVVHQPELCAGCQRLISGKYLPAPLSGSRRAHVRRRVSVMVCIALV